MKSTYFVLLMAAVGVSGCTTFKSSQELISNPKTVSFTLQAPVNYQKAYRTLSEVTRACLQGGAVGNDRRTEENLDTKTQVGTIAAINKNLFWGDDYLSYYEIKPVAAEKSSVTVYHPKSALGFYDDQRVVQSWLDGSKKCPL